MGSQTWGTGTDIFAVDYLDTQVPDSGNNRWKSADAKNHMLSAIELKNLTGYYEAGSDTATSHISDTNTPFNRGTDGASTGYYRTLYYTSKTKGDYFYTQNVLMYDRHIITNISDIQRLVWKPTVTKTPQTVTLVDGTTANITIYSVQSFQANKIDILKKNDPEQTTATSINVIPALISPTVSDTLQTFPYWNRDSENITWVDGIVYRYALTYGTGANNVARYCPFISDNKIIFPNSDSETTRYVVDKSGKYILSVTYRAGDQYSYMTNMYANARYYIIAEDEFLHVLARAGLKFEYENTLYKPIAENGVIVGYTSDMTKMSEWDNWHDYNDHEVPVTPPVPPTPSGDDIDKQHFGGGTGLGGAENLWLLTTAQMASLHNAISSCDVPNFEPLNSVISVMGLAIPPTYPLGTDIATLITINIKKSDGTLWSTHTEGHICDKQTASFGFTNNIKIKRRYNNFLDYPPYSSHEIFLPLCGWLPLPAYAVGRNLTVYYVHDINTCSVRGLVFCEGSLIGEKYGTMGANIPFSSSGHSLYVGGLITGGVQTLADFATAVSSKGPIALMSAIQGVAEGANTLLASNQNRTSVIGQNQDRTSFADGQYIRIKSTYPDVKIEENFGHTFGFVCNKKGQLKDFKGFTTCENPHVYGFSCTSEEKDEIERLLKAGIIINIPEE